MKPSQKGHKDAPISLTPTPGLSGTYKTPGRELEDIRVLTGFLMMDLVEIFTATSEG